uniref:Neuromedin-K n=1 Tax=Salarias fasciatus TaxID=181472 RepID=A0A672JNW1_SALFA
MERLSVCCVLASLVLLMTLVCFPVSSCYTQLKRFDDGIDYDTFVSLMGRRSAATPNRNINGILAELLGRTSETFQTKTKLTKEKVPRAEAVTEMFISAHSC